MDLDIYEKSLEILRKIIKAQKKYDFRIILIGGWGVYCYNPYMKSKDIDFLIKEQDIWKLKKFLDTLGFKETSKVLEKRGFALIVGDDKIELDVYDKNIGGFDVNKIFDRELFVIKKLNGQKVNVADVNLLLTLKIISGSGRIGTGKGMKDISDILSIFDKFFDNIDFSFVYSNVDTRVVNKVFSIIFSDYKKIRNLYPISFLKFERIKNALKNLEWQRI